MDISNLTSQISALRAETQERSITPERVGNILQQLANLIKGTAESSATLNDINEINDNALSNLSATVTASANGITVTLTLTELDGGTSQKTFTIPVASASAAGLLSPTDYNSITSLTAHFVQIGPPNGVWQATANAEDVAATIPYCNDPNKWVLWYYVVGSQYGYIEQSVCGDTCIQLLHWDKKLSQRTITFTDSNRTAISTVSPWTVMTLPEKTTWENLLNMVELDNMGIRFLGDVGNASSVGEEAAAQLDIAAATRIKWIIYKYGSNMGMIHQTHNATTTVQDLYYGGNRHSVRVITFTDSQRTAIASVGSWTAMGTDIGISRSATTATIKLVHPFMEHNAGVLTLTLGQANSNYAGLMTKENLRTLNYLDEQFEELSQTVTELGNAISSLQDSIAAINTRINNLDNRYVMKAKLFPLARPSSITIPVKNATSSGATVASNVEIDIQLSALDEDDNAIDAMDCTVTWTLGTNDSVFHVEHENGKRYITFYADEDDYWPGNEHGRLTITLTDNNRNVSGSFEVTLQRTVTQN